jgi:tRNA(Arg) A34 adenosine deaminase TadA
VDAAALRALELAWEAGRSGTVPVGAVVTNVKGVVVFEGRSRMYERSAPPGELAGSLLAHAEVNALARLDPARRHENLTITSALEPCPLCLGATHMATVGRLVFLGADPYGRLQSTPHTSRVPLLVVGPSPDNLGRLASALHVAFYLDRNPTGHVVSTHQQLAPRVVAAAAALMKWGWQSKAKSGAVLTEVLPDLLAVVSGIDASVLSRSSSWRPAARRTRSSLGILA